MTGQHRGRIPCTENGPVLRHAAAQPKNGPKRILVKLTYARLPRDGGAPDRHRIRYATGRTLYSAGKTRTSIVRALLINVLEDKQLI